MALTTTYKAVLGFAWQNGDGAFSVSESSVEAVTAYISDQAEHQRKFSYQERATAFNDFPTVACDLPRMGVSKARRSERVWVHCSTFAL